jgi:dynein heavy chain 2, cytosolic
VGASEGGPSAGKLHVVGSTAAALGRLLIPSLDSSATSSRHSRIVDSLQAALKDVELSVNPTSDEDVGATPILSIEAEAAAWERFVGDRQLPPWAPSRSIDAAEALAAVQRLAAAHTKLQSTGGTLTDFVDASLAALEDVWRVGAFSEPRMRSVLRAVDDALAAAAERTAGDPALLWRPGAADDVTALHAAIHASQLLAKGLQEMTGTFWPAGRPRWTGPVELPALSLQVAKRAEDAVRVLQGHAQLCELAARASGTLPSSLAAAAQAAWKHLASGGGSSAPNEFRPLVTSPAEWSAVLKEYNTLIAPVQAVAVEQLRARLAEAAPSKSASWLDATGAFSEAVKYRHVVSRDGAAKALNPELTALLERLKATLEAIDSELDARTSARIKGDANAARVSTVGWAQGLRSRISRLQSQAASVLGHLPGWASTQEQFHDLHSRAKHLQKTQVSTWTDSAASVLSTTLHSSEGGRLMSFDTFGNMRVLFNEQAVGIIRQARSLASMGFPPPPTLVAQVTEAERSLRFASALRKVAAFYNTMGAQIVPSTKPLLLDAIAVFEDAVQGGSNPSWSNARECATYVTSLQDAATHMELQIQQYRAAHEQLATVVSSIAALDLLKQQSSFRKLVRSIRHIVEPVVRGKPKEQALTWLKHWDIQLYKAVEAAWRMGLESLVESLPTIRCELVFANRAVTFRPSLEELRMSYYRELKKFLVVPSSMPTLLGSEHRQMLFDRMTDRNPGGMVGVYRKAEILFARLGKLRDQLAPWGAIGRVNPSDAALETLVAALMEGSDDWAGAVRDLNQRRKDLERVPDEHRVDCVAVSTVAFKAAVDDQLQRLSDSLLYALKNVVMEKVEHVEDFLSKAHTELTRPLKSLSDIAAAQSSFTKISASKHSIHSMSGDIDSLKKQLLQLAQQSGGPAAMSLLTAPSSGDGPSVLQRISDLPAAYDTFERALGAFHSTVESERERLKSSVEAQVVELGRSASASLSRWNGVKPHDDADSDWSEPTVRSAISTVRDWAEKVQELVKQAQELRASCEAFALRVPDWPDLNTLSTDVGETNTAWGIMEQYLEAKRELSAHDWLGFRSRAYELQDFAQQWADKAKETSTGRPIGVLARVLFEVNLVRRAEVGLKFIRGEPFRDEHWSVALMKVGVQRGVRATDLTVGHLLQQTVLEALSEQTQFLKELAARAQGEVTIRESLQELRAWTETAEFQLLEHTSLATDRTTPLIKEWQELFTQIGDNQSLLQSLKESSFFKPFADQVAPLERRLALLDECCQDLNTVQRRWVYLEPVFGRGALPSEQPRFLRVDHDFRDVMARIAREPRMFLLTDEGLFPNLTDSLKGMVSALERCQKALSEFLEEKRNAFPRFYFLGDEDLLEILGQSKNPTVVQSHLGKLFQGLHSVEFEPGSAAKKAPAILAMQSMAGEVIPLVGADGRPAAVATEGANVEDWLADLVTSMRRTLAWSLHECRAGGGLSDLSRYPSQVLCLSEEVRFAAQVERALADGGHKAVGGLKADNTGMLRKLTALANDTLAPQPTEEAKQQAALLRLKLKALILDTIHRGDVLEQLDRDGAAAASAWAWHRQLRFYPSTDSKPAWEAPRGIELCEARMVSAVIDYTYEYQGNTPKLVHTPLTDKCYLTLTQGISLGYGGNPYGPAGTGKTESVKALGAALGRQVLVFNCDEGIDFQSMGRIFTGLVRCGSWGCFDEFNRLKPDQLSAVSQQIQVIQAAIKAQEPSLQLLGRSIAVDPAAGIFVTMNPAGKGYGGRSKLPDNLKQLFRPVAMSKPDNEQIAEVLLYAEGFSTARDLGRKIACLFSLAQELLTQQQHYDWGLRAMKTCLNTSGVLLSVRQKQEGAKLLTKEAEAAVLIQAIRINTLSKLTVPDAGRFNDLIADVFPGASLADARSAELEAAIEWAMNGKRHGDSPLLQTEGGVALGKLKVDKGQVEKMLQLNESLDQRMGCVIVGPSGCGKTTLWRVLRAAIRKCGTEVKVHVMNPKAMPRSKLLGEMDPDTREWTDGVLTAAARQVVREPREVRSWIVCDGDVDPEWIESLNSVLDDNHLLTLPNGERISFGPNVNFLFETHDLRHASPATISRMGMIYLSDDDVDPRRVVDSWLEDRGDLKSSMTAWVERLLLPSIDWVRAHVKSAEFATPSTLVALVRSGLSQVETATSMLDFAKGVVNGLGANLSLERRAHLAREVFNWAGTPVLDLSKPLDSAVDPTTGSLVPWASIAARETTVTDATTQVPTVSLLRNESMLATWFDRMDPILLVGPGGCGKTLLVHRAVHKRPKTSLAVVHCSSQTSPRHIIDKLKQSCALSSSASGRVFRPKQGDRLVLFVRGIDLPRPDVWGTCALVSFLQQLVAFGGFYDALEFFRLEKVQLVASMSPQDTMGRHPLSSRFTAAVRAVYIDEPSAAELTLVTREHLRRWLDLGGPKSSIVSDAKFTGSAAPDALNHLAAAMVGVWASVRSRFNVDAHRHYIFTPRDLITWVDGLRSYSLSEGEDLLNATVYEGARLFRDRLVTVDERARFDGMLLSAFRAEFSATPDVSRMVYTGILGDATKSFQLRSASGKAYLDACAKGIVKFEREERPLPIKLFKQSLLQLAAVDRCLSRKGGCMTLIGRPGVGRRSAVSLIAHLHGMKWVEPSPGFEYGIKQFRADLRNAMQSAAVEDGGQDVVLYVPEHVLTDSHLLESLNSLVAAGEVPGLFTHDEVESGFGSLREDLGSSDLSEPERECRTVWELFTLRVQRNLRIVVALDFADPHFAQRCEANPALLTSTTVSWFGDWVPETLEALPPLLLDEADESVKVVTPLMAHIHQWCARTTEHRLPHSPREYIALIKAHEGILAEQRSRSQGNANRLEGGLTKLQDAARTVDTLSKEAAEQEAQLKEKQIAADNAMHEITEALSMASDRRKEVEVLQKEAAIAEEATAARKADVETELGGIMPVLEAAREAVGGIDLRALHLIRSFKAPPEPVVHVLSGVLCMLGNEDTSWSSMRRFLGAPGVKDSVINFDPRTISPETRSAVAHVIKEHSTSFDATVIKKAAEAAAPFAAWVKACLKFSIVLEKIQPLEAELVGAVAELDRARRQLDSNKRELDTIDRKVSALKTEFQNRTAEAETLKIQLHKTQDTLTRAEKLLGQLSGEKSRWEGTVRSTREMLAGLPILSLAAAAFTVYLAGSPEDVRTAAMSAWKGLGLGELSGFSVQRFLSSESQALEWRADGLPDDSLSTENATVILHSHSKLGRAPFIVDPSGTARSWLGRMLAKAATEGGASPIGPVETVVAGSKRFQSAMELAVRFGKTLVVDNASTVDPMFHSVLAKEVRAQGARQTVLIGDKPVDFSPQFQVYFCTQDASVALPPSLACMVNVVNFSVTRSGLEGQLLGATLREVMPHLETEKSRLLREEETLKMQLTDLESRLIAELASSEGNLLENASLVASLTQTKIKAGEISKALEDSAVTSDTIDRQRDAFRPLAHAGSKLYFLVCSLKSRNHMYQFSLSEFLQVFIGTVKVGMAVVDTGKEAAQVARLLPELQRRVLLHFSRSLLKEDRLMYALHLVHGCRPELFAEHEWELFTGLADATDDASGVRLPHWAPSDRAAAYAALSRKLGERARTVGLGGAVDGSWDTWGRDPESGIDNMPASAGSSLSPWQRVLVVRALRPDRLVSAMTSFVCQALGVDAVSPHPTTLLDLATEASWAQPLMMITTPGADPTRDLKDAADGLATGLSRSSSPLSAAATAVAAASPVERITGYYEVAMGGGQQEEALRLIERAAREGGWVCLKNLHLVTSWLPTLQRVIGALSADTTDPRFRLWLSTECQDDFPPVLLQSSLKVTFEAPPGLRRNIERTVASWSDSFLDKGPPMRGQLLALLAWFHGVVQERRTYVPQGWTKAYEFSASDLRAAATVIDGLVARSKGGEFPWKTLHGLVESALYGGRVDDPADVRILRAFVRIYFHPQLLPDAQGQMGKPLFSGVHLPSSAERGNLDRFAATLPASDVPRLFRLPLNAERSLQRATSDGIVASLVSLAVDTVGASDLDTASLAKQLGPVLDLWDEARRAIEPLDPAGRAAFKSDDPVTNFVALELKRGEALALAVEKDMSDLRKTLFGSAVMTSHILQVAMSLIKAQVPTKWLSRWDKALDPRAWMQAVVAKVRGLRDWAKSAADGSLLRKPLHLDELFRPATLLNAVRQKTARATGIAIDDLRLANSFEGTASLEAQGVPPSLVLSVDGLLIQGALLRGSPPILHDVDADSPELASAPRCFFGWVATKGAPDTESEGPLVRMPLYMTPQREQIVADVHLPVGPSKGNTIKWVLAGLGVFVGAN